jgi:hypothetical protein
MIATILHDYDPFQLTIAQLSFHLHIYAWRSYYAILGTETVLLTFLSHSWASDPSARLTHNIERRLFLATQCARLLLVLSFASSYWTIDRHPSTYGFNLRRFSALGFLLRSSPQSTTRKLVRFRWPHKPILSPLLISINDDALHAYAAISVPIHLLSFVTLLQFRIGLCFFLWYSNWSGP